MRYTVSTEIALPRESVVQLLADPVHLPRWLRGLVLHEPIDGLHGEGGTRSRVVLRTGGQEMEAVENHHAPGTGGT
ncbi:SRPBCC family protein [Pseudonocardia sp. ICBG601]|uniref:SRPBCC family protein n=1 Tax=Pseudonocardia sp. ICBG601 TaxID=2846759 RepID=UPI001CF634F7|nr:SRPBCC family protein [Pseudonocardia sp. ICBG601]